VRYLILGASAAGLNAAQTIRELDSGGEITVLSVDREIYSRCLLPGLIGRPESATRRRLKHCG
jgi:nitrite reductase (NADH) large subunit